ncbi:MAG: hypothetical protein KIT22_05620 [Verrucomicrobiae bacterium]|nr:hypothetical protein [Verrucomicrobiae bacterium]
MKKRFQFLSAAGLSAMLTLGTVGAFAQNADEGGRRRNREGGPGNFDPEQFRQRMAERQREQLEVKDDAEWKIIEARINKVNAARSDIGFGGMGLFGGRGGGPGGPGGAGGPGGGAGGGGRRFGPEPSAEAQALQTALEKNAPADEIKAKLAKYRDSVKAKEAALEKAQTELREVLSAKQEATAVLMGLLK